MGAIRNHAIPQLSVRFLYIKRYLFIYETLATLKKMWRGKLPDWECSPLHLSSLLNLWTCETESRSWLKFKESLLVRFRLYNKPNFLFLESNTLAGLLLLIKDLMCASVWVLFISPLKNRAKSVNVSDYRALKVHMQQRFVHKYVFKILIFQHLTWMLCHYRWV